MNNVTMICQPPSIFTIEEANSLIPLISRIVEKHQARVEKLLDDQRYFMRCGVPEEKIRAIDEAVGRELVQWGAKLLKLGVTSLPHGFVGFDFGCGYWSYHFPETRIEYYHGYNDPPHSRRKLNYQTGPVL